MSNSFNGYDWNDDDEWDTSDMERTDGQWSRAASVVMIVVVLAVLLGCAFGSICFGAEAPDMGPVPPAGISPSTARVNRIDHETGLCLGSGSGVLVAKDADSGTVATARHVAYDKKHPEARLVVVFPQSAEFAYVAWAAFYSRADDGPDIAILKIDPPADVAPRPIAWRIPDPGEKVWQSGYGNSKEPPLEYWSRVVSTDDSLLILDKHTRHGDSGCPVIDATGHVIGITSSGDGWKYREGRRTGQRDPLGYHTTLADQPEFKAAILEHSILLE